MIEVRQHGDGRVGAVLDESRERTTGSEDGDERPSDRGVGGAFHRAGRGLEEPDESDADRGGGGTPVGEFEEVAGDLGCVTGGGHGSEAIASGRGP